MQEYDWFISSISIPKKSRKSGPDVGFYCNLYVLYSNCFSIFELLLIFLLEVSIFPKFKEYENKKCNKYKDKEH